MCRERNCSACSCGGATYEKAQCACSERELAPSIGSTHAVQGGGDFDCPPRLAEMIGGGSGSTGATATAATAETPVCICYSTDTVGGNSGSPVLDSEGNFVAINFDRQRQGLMNEFKWSHDYSRSIGTDVRYILFLVGHHRFRARQPALASYTRRRVRVSHNRLPAVS